MKTKLEQQEQDLDLKNQVKKQKKVKMVQKIKEVHYILLKNGGKTKFRVEAIHYKLRK